MENNFVNIKDLFKRYGNTVALNNVNINLRKGRVIGLLGPNGCGKTTLIKILANLLNQYQGDVNINGIKPGVETKKIISYLPDRNYLPNQWTANQAINFFKDFYDDFDEQRAHDLVKKLEIRPNAMFKTLSKGNKDKLQLVLVLSRRAQLYLFDEPIAGVDPAARELIFDLILENYHKEATVIITTHLVYDVEKILDDVIFLKKGMVTRYGEVEQITSTTGKSIEELFKEDFKWSSN